MICSFLFDFQCSKTCGSGIQRREAYCVDELERPMNENKCDPQEKITEKVCETQNCPTWSFGDWSAVSFKLNFFFFF